MMYLLLVSLLASSVTRGLSLTDCNGSTLDKWDQVRVGLRGLGDQIEARLSQAPICPGRNATSSSCALTCDVLTVVLGDEVVESPNPAYYQQNFYWSAIQSDVQPRCRVEPQNAKEVAAILRITKIFDCRFAVKSGGHASFAGASNIQGGVTIDLRKLNEVTVTKNKTVTQVGTGNKWVDVYTKLDAQLLSVVGGRVSDIGVGGLTLGGGISFFSGRYGWACDGVLNYQVVSANGNILEVNQSSYPDLYFALRGGGNNFGIVTRLDLDTFPQGDLWGGMRNYAITANASIFAAYNNFANNAPSDVDASIIFACALFQGQFFLNLDLEYAKPVVNPPIFHEFSAIPYLTSTTRITKLTDLVVELNASNPSGFRETYTTATFHNSPELQTKILEIFIAETFPLANVTGIIPALVMQPITKPIISHFSRRGGNALGISPSDGPLILMNLSIMWALSIDDARVIAAAGRIIDRSVAVAKTMGLDYRYIYQNYASLNQDVFASYGEENLQRLKEVSKKYDPDGVFEKLQPGYFKLSGVNGGAVA